MFARLSWGQHGSGCKLHWVSWAKMCDSKLHWGLGLRNLEIFNLSLFAKEGWRLLTNSDFLLLKLFKAKYFPHTTFLQSNIGCNHFYVWRSICAAKDILIKVKKNAFPPYVAKKIDHIPLHSWTIDKIVWSGNRNGMYSVKSGYHFTIGLFKNGGWVESLHSRRKLDFWQKLWNLSLSNKVKKTLLRGLVITTWQLSWICWE